MGKGEPLPLVAHAACAGDSPQPDTAEPEASSSTTRLSCPSALAARPHTLPILSATLSRGGERSRLLATGTTSGASVHPAQLGR